MEKKFLFIAFLFLVILLNLFSNSTEDPIKNNFSFLAKFNDIENYADKPDKEPPDLGKIDTALKYTHASFAGVTYASLWALDAIGLPLLYLAFNDPTYQYYNGLVYAHLGIAISALLSFATTITIAFTKLGIKLKNGFEIRKTHLTAAIVTLSFFLIELPTAILSAVYFANNIKGKEWVGLAHGITCAASTAAFTVSFITIFF